MNPLQNPSRFYFVTCQVGAEGALKREVQSLHAQLRFAYSRPGFLTFKWIAEAPPPESFRIRSTFARATGDSLGKVTGANGDELTAAVADLSSGLTFQRLHVWQRDESPAGWNGYEPTHTPRSIEAAARIRERLVSRVSPATDAAASLIVSPPCSIDEPFHLGDEVLDVVLVDEHEWWVGRHRVSDRVSSWPGGLMPDSMVQKGVGSRCRNGPQGASHNDSRPLFEPDSLSTAPNSGSSRETEVRNAGTTVSRGFRKIQEALLWSKFAVAPGDRCVEVGCAPGGASQFLLESGLIVVGIDPAAVDPVVARNPNFRHVARRVRKVSRDDFAGAKWVFIDINLPPRYVLDLIAGLLEFPDVQPQGILATFKLGDWSLAEEVPHYLQELRRLGWRHVEARQLHQNRQEICVSASLPERAVSHRH